MSLNIYLSKSFDEMQKIGVQGIICYWCKMVLLLTLFVNSFFAIYELVITAPKIWLQAIGGGLLSVSLFLFIFSITSAVFLILALLDIKIGNIDNFPFLLSCILTFATLITQASLLSQTTSTKADIMIDDLKDFCIRNYENVIVHDFLISHSSDYSFSYYVMQRTSEIYGAAATLMTLLIIFAGVHSFTLFLLMRPNQPDGFNNDVPLDRLHPLRPN